MLMTDTHTIGLRSYHSMAAVHSMPSESRRPTNGYRMMPLGVTAPPLPLPPPPRAAANTPPPRAAANTPPPMPHNTSPLASPTGASPSRQQLPPPTVSPPRHGGSGSGVASNTAATSPPASSSPRVKPMHAAHPQQSLSQSQVLEGAKERTYPSAAARRVSGQRAAMHIGPDRDGGVVKERNFTAPQAIPAPLLPSSSHSRVAFAPGLRPQPAPSAAAAAGGGGGGVAASAFPSEDVPPLPSKEPAPALRIGSRLSDRGMCLYVFVCVCVCVLYVCMCMCVLWRKNNNTHTLLHTHTRSHGQMIEHYTSQARKRAFDPCACSHLGVRVCC